MKTPVATKRKRIFLTILTIICWVCVAILIDTIINTIKDLGIIVYRGMIIGEVVIMVLIAAAMTVWTCLVIASNVVINKDGITQRIGAIKVKHFSWDEVRRVETFDALYRKSLFWAETYISVLTTNKESWAFKYKRPPVDVGANNISFVYDFEALARIEQYFKGDICR